MTSCGRRPSSPCSATSSLNICRLTPKASGSGSSLLTVGECDAEEFAFNIYTKTVAFLEVVEQMDPNISKDLMKGYFEMLFSDLDIISLEGRNLDEAQIEAELKSQKSNSLSIEDLNWRLINIGHRSYAATPASTDYIAQVEQKEIINEVLEMILLKSRFFNEEEMIVPLRFCVMGGSQDLQLMCQNFGSLFEVLSPHQAPPHSLRGQPDLRLLLAVRAELFGALRVAVRPLVSPPRALDLLLQKLRA